MRVPNTSLQPPATACGSALELSMKTKMLFALLVLAITTLTSVNVTAQDGNSSIMLQPPTPEKKPKTTEINGEKLVDNYFWLREKSNAAVIAHLEAENAYTAAVMKPTQAFQ